MKKKCGCGFCESELVQDCMEPSFCKPCDVVLTKCQQCGASYSSKLSKCPECEKKQGCGE
jgi:hypothetical protein